MHYYSAPKSAHIHVYPHDKLTLVTLDLGAMNVTIQSWPDGRLLPTESNYLVLWPVRATDPVQARLLRPHLLQLRTCRCHHIQYTSVHRAYQARCKLFVSMLCQWITDHG